MTAWFKKAWNALVKWGSKKENQQLVIEQGKKLIDEVKK